VRVWEPRGDSAGAFSGDVAITVQAGGLQGATGAEVTAYCVREAGRRCLSGQLQQAYSQQRGGYMQAGVRATAAAAVAAQSGGTPPALAFAGLAGLQHRAVTWSAQHSGGRVTAPAALTAKSGTRSQVYTPGRPGLYAHGHGVQGSALYEGGNWGATRDEALGQYELDVALHNGADGSSEYVLGLQPATATELAAARERGPGWEGRWHVGGVSAAVITRRGQGQVLTAEGARQLHGTHLRGCVVRHELLSIIFKVSRGMRVVQL
jgi:hypothetical protein